MCEDDGVVSVVGRGERGVEGSGSVRGDGLASCERGEQGCGAGGAGADDLEHDGELAAEGGGEGGGPWDAERGDEEADLVEGDVVRGETGVGGGWVVGGGGG